MTKKLTEAQRMRAEMIETARGLHRVGIMRDATLDKITARDVDLDKLPKVKPPSGAEIVAMRERAHMSQAVFARFLNVGTSTLSQWEREEKRPRGAAARLLAIVKQKGVEAIL
jgi:putative transcriptional regulator